MVLNHAFDRAFFEGAFVEPFEDRAFFEGAFVVEDRAFFEGAFVEDPSRTERSLKVTTTSIQKYERHRRLWRTYGMRSIRTMLRWMTLKKNKLSN